jgi:hypothetical protein
MRMELAPALAWASHTKKPSKKRDSGFWQHNTNITFTDFSIARGAAFERCCGIGEKS